MADKLEEARAHVKVWVRDKNHAVGYALKEMRERAEDTSTRLAHVIGTSQVVYSKIELGERHLTCGELIAIAEHWGFTPGELIEELLNSV